MNHKGVIFLAAGGTGGHIFPAKATAEELSLRGYKVVFISDERYNNYKLYSYPKEDVYLIRSATIHGDWQQKLEAFAMIFQGFIQSIILIKRYNPKLIVGFGGYPSMPVMLAGNIMRIKTMIHEQNSVLGKVNRFFSFTAKLIATSFEKTMGIKPNHKRKIKFTGNPVRSEVKKLVGLPVDKAKENGPLNILVIGGSQGAAIFSKIVPQAIIALPEELRDRIFIVQQARKSDIEEVEDLYDDYDIDCVVKPFFENIAHEMLKAHLIIARSGAGTIAELLLMNRKAILVPLPNATDAHQYHNAKEIAETGKAILVTQKEFTSEKLAEILTDFLENPNKIYDNMERDNKILDGTKNVANCVEFLIKEK